MCSTLSATHGNDQLVPIRIGRSVRFPVDQLERFVAERAPQTLRRVTRIVVAFADVPARPRAETHRVAHRDTNFEDVRFIPQVDRWAQRDSNPRHLPCKGSALAN